MVILVLVSREQISRLSPTVHLSHRPYVTDKLLVYNHVSRLFTLDDFSGICEAGAAPDLILTIGIWRRCVFYGVKTSGELDLILELNYPPLKIFYQIPGLHSSPTGQEVMCLMACVDLSCLVLMSGLCSYLRLPYHYDNIH